jgi:hypothetical protein
VYVGHFRGRITIFYPCRYCLFYYDIVNNIYICMFKHFYFYIPVEKIGPIFICNATWLFLSVSLSFFFFCFEMGRGVLIENTHVTLRGLSPVPIVYKLKHQYNNGLCFLSLHFSLNCSYLTFEISKTNVLSMIKILLTWKRKKKCNTFVFHIKKKRFMFSTWAIQRLHLQERSRRELQTAVVALSVLTWLSIWFGIWNW